MTSPAAPRTKSWQVGLVIALCGLYVIAPAIGLGLPAEVCGKLVAGWMSFLSRVVGKISISWVGVLSALVWGGGFVAGLHWFAQWFTAARQVESGEKGRTVWPWRWTLSIAGLIVTAFAAGIALTGVAHQTLWLLTSPEPLTRPPESLARVLSRNNLKQTGLAMWNLHDLEGQFPAGATFDSAGRPLHGWQTALLQLLGQDAVAHRIDRARPWNDPVNSRALRQPIPEYLNPAYSAPQFATERLAETHYAGNVLMLGDQRLRAVQDIPDGLSNTMLVGEIRDRFVPWGRPRNVRDLQLGINQSPDGFGSPFSGGGHIMMADGSVQFLSENVDPKVLRYLATPAGGELPPEW
ncbi:MAG: DUF1559 domain-containing protein [Planctomycetaceae bacterium]|jgi:hypothetical protein